MEVVSTLNLVSSETEKTTAACNFQHDYTMRGIYEAIHESYFMIAEMWKSTPRNTYTQNSRIEIKKRWEGGDLFQGFAVFTWKIN